MAIGLVGCVGQGLLGRKPRTRNVVAKDIVKCEGIDQGLDTLRVELAQLVHVAENLAQLAGEEARFLVRKMKPRQSGHLANTELVERRLHPLPSARAPGAASRPARRVSNSASAA